MFFSETNGMMRIETRLGSLQVTSLEHSWRDQYTLIHIPDGNFDKHVDRLSTQVTLKRLGCFPNEEISLDERKQQEMEEQFFKLYNIDSSTNISNALKLLLEQIQCSLRHLSYYEGEISGTYSEKLLEGVITWSSSRYKNKQIHTEHGHLNPEIVKNIKEEVINWKNKLETLGYSIHPFDPIQQSSRFTKIIKQFQTDNRLNETGKLERKTKSAIEKLLSGSSPLKQNQLKEELKNEFISPPPHVPEPEAEEDSILPELMVKLSHLGGSKKNNRFSILGSIEEMGAKSKEVIKGWAGGNPTTFLITERERAKNWQSKGWVTILKEQEEITGYKLFVVEEWAIDQPTFRRSIIETGNMEDKLIVSVVKTKTFPSEEQKTAFKKYFGECKHQEVPEGTLLMQNRSTMTNCKYNFIEIPDGDFDSHIGSIELQLTLRRLGCGFYPISLKDEAQNLSILGQKLKGLYAIPLNANTANSAWTLVLEVNYALMHLRFLLPGNQMNSYDGSTIKAMIDFQSQYKMNPTGFLSGQAYQSLFEKIMQYKFFLENSGQKVETEDPFKDYKILSKAIKNFEENTEKKNARKILGKFHLLNNSNALYALPFMDQPTIPVSNAMAIKNSGIFSDNNYASGREVIMSGNYLNDSRYDFREKDQSPPNSLPSTYPPVSSVPAPSNNNNVNSLNAKDREEMEYLKGMIIKLEREVNQQEEQYSSLLYEYEKLEKKYSALKEGVERENAKLEVSKLQSQDTKSSYARLQSDFSHTKQILKEHNETIQGYTQKIDKLGEKVETMHRDHNRSFLRNIGASLLVYLITIVSFVVISFFKIGGAVKRISKGGNAPTLNIEQTGKRFNEMLEENKKSLEGLSDDWKMESPS
eukprot:TRINITY_DN5841_c0_g1_i2.p1 TRINITY_DN5841_c0_g1~~TRINITY_DN5841_c0_g1_i2.p1  ORF type:complete len:869 (-),score=311.21 TRINITY_DN5841_c0_g1_i2:50-2656(-)